MESLLIPFILILTQLQWTLIRGEVAWSTSDQKPLLFWLHLVGVWIGLSAAYSLIVNLFWRFIIFRKLVLGAASAGRHPMDTDSYVQRWKLWKYFEVAPADIRGFLLGGTVYKCWFERLGGAKIGSNVCLFPCGADPDIVEPEIIKIGDGAMINKACLIGHINTFGSLQINPVTVRGGASMRSLTRLSSGATLGRGATLLEHTLVLPGDLIDRGMMLQGAPAHEVTDHSDSTVVKFLKSEADNEADNANEMSPLLKKEDIP
jgi:acetyltransferase-like isoleucine patch superfamily enzyme